MRRLKAAKAPPAAKALWAVKALRPVCFALLAFACLPASAERHSESGYVHDGIPPIDAALTAEWRQFAGGRSARLLDWLSDGSLLIATRFGRYEQVHRVRQPLGEREQQTFGEGDALWAVAPRRAADRFAYQAASARGDALFLQVLDAGAPRELAPASAAPGPAAFSSDGKRVAWSDHHRDGLHDDLYIEDTEAAAGNGRLVSAGATGEWRVVGWSSDDKRLLVWQRDPVQGDALLLVDVASGARQTLALQPPPTAAELRAAPRAARGKRSAGTHTSTGARTSAGARTAARERTSPGVVTSADVAEPMHLDAPMPAPDGRGVYFLDRGGEHVRLRYVSFDGSEQREPLADREHDIDHYDVSADGRYLACSYVANGLSQLLLVDQTAKLELRLPGLPQGEIDALRFDRTGARLAIGVGTATQPDDVYVYGLADHSLERWTRSEPGAVAADALVTPTRARFPTWDRVGGEPRQLEALIHRPRADGLHGVLVLLPGDAPLTPQYDPFIQYTVAKLGLIVVQPALRGTRGFDRGAAMGSPVAHRDETLRDLGFLLAWLSLQPGVDRQHLIVAGSGSGGSQALAALSLFGDRLQGAIAMDGGVGANEAAAINRPVLLLRGFSTRDWPATEAEQMLWRLRNGGSRVWYASVDAAGADASGANADAAGANAAAAGARADEAARLSLGFLRELLSAGR